MEKIELDPSKMTERLVNQEARIRLLEERSAALQLVLGWSLSQMPKDEALRFLSRQENEFAEAPQLQETVAVLDELREEVLRWNALWSSSDSRPRS